MLPKDSLSHVLWLGGATDSGKSTVARELAKRRQFAVYHYDEASNRHYEALAGTETAVRKFLSASLDERWIDPTPQEMVDYLLTLFPLPFQLLLEELLTMPTDKVVVVEGFGLLPELVQPYLSRKNQAIWFVPTRKFKWESMERRGKPSFGPKTSNPQRAKTNLFERDMLLADYFRENVSLFDYRLHETDGELSIEKNHRVSRKPLSKLFGYNQRQFC